MVKHNKLCAQIRKMASRPIAKPKVFEKVHCRQQLVSLNIPHLKVLHFRYMLDGLSMIKNDDMTMDIRKKVLIRITGGSVPMYYVLAACFNERELKFIRDNARVS